MAGILVASALIASQLMGAAAAQAQEISVTASSWSRGPDAIGNPTYSGTLDQPTSAAPSVLSGWVVDTTAQGWSGIDDVQIWNGLMDGSGQLVAHPTLQVDRPDVAESLNNPFWEASGYSANVPTTTLESNSVLYVYAHTPAKGWWYQLVILSLPIGPIGQLEAGPRLDIEFPTALGTVHNNTPFTIRGTAYDPSAAQNQGTGVDRVQVYLNGDRKSGMFIGDATLGVHDQFAANAGQQFANAGWQLTFQAGSWLGPNISDNTITKLTVYAHSSVTGQETQSETSIVVSVP